MKVLVTGAGGYIGNILTGLLTKKGHEVVALDRYNKDDGLCMAEEMES